MRDHDRDAPDAAALAALLERPGALAGLRDDLEVPWDEVRAARVQRRALAAFRQSVEDDLAAESERELAAEDARGGDGDLALEEAPLEQPPADEVSTEDATAEDGPSDEPARLEVPLVRPSRWWLAALAAVAAALVLMLLRPTGEPVVAEDAAGSALKYTDGSRSLLSEGAEVSVVDDRPALVEVRQTAGRVRYEITRRPERRFVVGARGVVVTVLGTIFDVDVQGDVVEVRVERGRVRVEHNGTQLELTKGQVTRIVAPDQATAAHARRAPAPEATPPAPPEEPSPAPAEQAHGGGAPSVPDAAELMRRADAARGAGRLDEAAATLRLLVSLHPRDRRVTLALFTLGRVERERGQHEAAARAFESCGGGLRGDAFAEAASSWAAAGQPARARAAAQRYLAAHPQGVHAEQMRALAGGS
ncbi:MAG: FecR domain-containing protein [Polyangiaceae bacterium]